MEDLKELKAKTEKYRKRMFDLLDDIDATIKEIDSTLRNGKEGD